MAKCFDISWKMVEVWTVAPEIYFWGGGEMSSKCFHQIQSRSKPCTEVILRYFSIKGPSKHLCTRWYKDGKVLNNSPRKQHWGTIVPEDNTNKENNIYVSALVIPLLRQLIKKVHEEVHKICPVNRRYCTVEQNKKQHCGRTERFKLWFFFFAFVRLDF